MKNYSPAIDGIPGIMPGTGSLVPPFEPVNVPNPIPESKGRKEKLKNLPKGSRGNSHKKQKKS